ncbi:TIM barrel protein [Comamonas sp.]|uniref:sugar phosphate isomerase/epimerase family protein n=1 Tax=Comamonas sp. TaxID=34028 RepID=UPI0028A271EB|nr:TIM barrel protein [Comamonas sp.]
MALSLQNAGSPALISLTSFGNAEVRRHGQLYFAQLAHRAGANGYEVREELLLNPADELPALAAYGRDHQLDLVYSCPQPLFAMDGNLNTAALQHAIAASHSLGATWLKMSIGGFASESVAHSAQGFAALKSTIDGAGLTLLIENDQTTAAGTVQALQRFFAAADAAGLPLPMTFDMGNWHYLGECALQAAQLFGSRVAYVHAKGVQRLPAKWVAVPLAESAAAWRAILRALPSDAPRAIEYPLIGDDLVAVTRQELAVLRDATALQAKAS